MSLNKLSTEKRTKNKNPYFMDIIKSHLTSDEINNNQVIKNIVKKIKKIKINSLTGQKPNLTPIKDIKDEKQKNLINNINSFRKIIYDYNKNQKVPKKNEVKVYKGQKNYDFSKLYNQAKKNNNLEQKEMLEEIKQLYNNNNISLPYIEKNMFKDNLLLINEKKIKNSIEFKLTTEKSNKNSLSYLTSIQKSINNKIIGKEKKAQFPKIKESLGKDVLITRNEIKEEKNIFSKNPKNDIASIKETINDMDDIDYFFDSNNKQYFNYLKDPESIKNSRNSSLINNSIKENKEDNAIDIFKLKVKKTKNNDKISYSKPISGINNNSQINIYNLNYNSHNKKTKLLNKNYSMDNIKENKINKLIKLKKIYLNGKIKNLDLKKKENKDTNSNIINLKNQPRKKSTEEQKRLSIRIPTLHSFQQSIDLAPSNLRVSLPLSKRPDYYNQKPKVESIYNKIKNKDDNLNSNDLIKNYLKSRKYNVEQNIEPIDICYHYQNIKENIFRNDYFKKYIRLKKFSGFEESTYENIKNEYDNSINKLNSLADDVNKIISNL